MLQLLRWQVDSLPLNLLGSHTSEFTFYEFSRREPSVCQVCAGGWVVQVYQILPLPSEAAKGGEGSRVMLSRRQSCWESAAQEVLISIMETA